MSNQIKWKCTSCDSISIDANLLKAKNPFDETLIITGCPVCKDVAGFTEICDEPNCVRNATCGFPTPEGYRRTCGEHMRTAAEIL